MHRTTMPFSLRRRENDEWIDKAVHRFEPLAEFELDHLYHTTIHTHARTLRKHFISNCDHL